MNTTDRKKLLVDKSTLTRTIITTDGEHDDMNSFRHLLLYNNELDIAGLIYSSSCHHWSGDEEGHMMKEVIDSYKGEPGYPGVEDTGLLKQFRYEEVGWMEDIIFNDYAKVYPNLIKHDPNYPTPGDLWSLTAVGNIEFESDYRFDTEGSDMIKEALLDNDERYLYIQLWGGANTTARALLSIEEEYREKKEWNEIYQKVSKKAVIVAIGAQDNAYQDYISENWPEIRYYDLGNIFGVYTAFGKLRVSEKYKYLYEGKWWRENIKFDHGPILSKYGLIGDGQYYEGEGDNPNWQPGMAKSPDRFKYFNFFDGFKRYDWTSEGDSPAFLFLLNVGLRGLEKPGLGSWGGRLKADDDNPSYYSAEADYNPDMGKEDQYYSLSRWLEHIQFDFAARADWCVSDYEDANHQPVVSVDRSDITAGAGERVTINGSAYDPDGDDLKYKWYQYKEAGSYNGKVKLNNSIDISVDFIVPEDAVKGDNISIIFEVSDSGSPQLTRYKQIIIRIN